MREKVFELGAILSSLFSGLKMGMAIFDGEARVLYWNPEMAGMSGVDPSAIVGRPLPLAFPEFPGIPPGSSGLPAPWLELLSGKAEGGGPRALSCGNLVREGVYPQACEVTLQALEHPGGPYLVATCREIPSGGPPGESGSASWEMDLLGGTIETSQEWLRRFSVREEAPGRYLLDSYYERVHPEDLALLKAAMGGIKAQGGWKDGIEYRLKDAYGDYVWVLDRVLGSRSSADGGIAAVSGRISDISLRKELEYSRREETHLLREVLDQAPQYIFARDLNGRFILVNRALADFYGKKEEELIGASLLDVHPDRAEAEGFLADDRHVIRTGESLIVPESTFTSRSGKKSIVEISLAPFNVPGLKDCSSLGFGIDITETKRAQRALYEERDRLYVTLRSLGEGVIAADTEGRVSLMNPMAENITGWDEREALGRPIGEIFKVRYGLDSHPLADPVKDILSERRIVSGAADTFIEKRSGELREITERGAPIIDEEGEVSGAVLIFLDVTERRSMEREIEKIQKVESLGLLAGGIAHDFNNILMAVLGNISLAKLNVEEDDENWKILAEAEKAILQAKRLTSQLSLMAKGGAEPRKETMSVRAMLEEACSINLRGSNVRYELDLCPEDIDILADPSLMNQVMQNLVINAKEAMPHGGILGIAVRIVEITRTETLPLSPGSYVRIDVEDSGPGILPEIAQRIFDPYYTTKSRGSGLGLTVSFSVVKKHGGCITVKSRLGEGTVFSVYLPKRHPAQ
jgi:PAS domain S-box-containing protein